MEFIAVTLYGILKLFFLVIIGTALGSVLDYKGWTNYISFILKPFLRFARLPSICGTSFITAVFSNPAASAILAGARKENHISRREMIVTGIVDTFPTHISHLTKATFVLIPLIGSIALFYYLIILVCDLIRTLIVLLYNRIYSERTDFNANFRFSRQEISWKEVFLKTYRRIFSVCKKLLTVFLPLYIFISYLVYIGFFKTLNSHLPLFFNNIVSPEMLSVAFSKVGGLTASATVANSLLSNSRIYPVQVLIALLIGNMITIPINTFRRNLPATVAIFPGKDGLWIVLITESINFALNFIAIIFLFFIIK